MRNSPARDSIESGNGAAPPATSELIITTGEKNRGGNADARVHQRIS